MKQIWKRNTKINTRTLTMLSTLAAMSILLKAYLSIMITTNMRVSLYDIPLIFAGVVFGPFFGGIAGFIVDWIYVILSPFAFSFNLMTISSIAWAFIPGLYFLFAKKVSYLNLAVVIIITSLIALSLNTWQLYIWSGEGAFAFLPYRIVVAVLKIPLQVYLTHMLYHRVYKKVVQ